MSRYGYRPNKCRTLRACDQIILFTSKVQVMYNNKDKPRPIAVVFQVSIAPSGVTLRWSHESLTLQCSVFIKSQLFTEYNNPDGLTRKIGIDLVSLARALTVLATHTSALTLRHPGPAGEMVLQVHDTDVEDIVAMDTYARVSALEPDPAGDLIDYWQVPDGRRPAPFRPAPLAA